MSDGGTPPEAADGAPADAPPPAAEGEATCPACGAPPSPGAWCIACGARFPDAPAEGSLPPGAAVAARKFACAGCGALMQWDASGSRLSCPFCGSTQAVERPDDYAPVEHALDHVPSARTRAEAPKLFHCDDCGAEVSFGGATVADRCPFCGADHVVERTGDPGRIRPESVAPFAVDQARAVATFRAWLARGWFRPRRVLDHVADAALRGVYVPHWTYDARTWSRWTATSGTHYWVTVPDGRGGTRRDRRTRWYPTSGERAGTYDDVLVPASKGLDERLLRKIGPFPLDDLAPYRAEYLAGWLAEEYVVDLPAGWAVAREQINADERAACASEVPGDTHRSLRVWTQHADVTWKHLLLPLWVASYRWRGKPYRFLVNGVTGKLAGTRPVSGWRVAAAALLLAALVGLVVWWARR